MVKSAEKRPTKAIMTALGKVFATEVDGAINDDAMPFQSKARIYTQLVEAGLLRNAAVLLSGRFPVVVRGFMLTPKGHFLYCANCEPEGEA
jgi:hypothetical protein